MLVRDFVMQSASPWHLRCHCPVACRYPPCMTHTEALGRKDMADGAGCPLPAEATAVGHINSCRPTNMLMSAESLPYDWKMLPDTDNTLYGTMIAPVSSCSFVPACTKELENAVHVSNGDASTPILSPDPDRGLDRETPGFDFNDKSPHEHIHS